MFRIAVLGAAALYAGACFGAPIGLTGSGSYECDPTGQYFRIGVSGTDGITSVRIDYSGPYGFSGCASTSLSGSTLSFSGSGGASINSLAGTFFSFGFGGSDGLGSLTLYDIGRNPIASAPITGFVAVQAMPNFGSTRVGQITVIATPEPSAGLLLLVPAVAGLLWRKSLPLTHS